MVCTDIAGRGLDISDLFTVVHFDLPFELNKFIHRSGRTGRAGRNGFVLSLYGTNN